MSLRKSVSTRTMPEAEEIEVSPAHDVADWRMPLEPFISKRFGSAKDRKMPKNIRSYYKAQDELISTYESIQARDENGQVDIEIDNSSRDKIRRVASVLAKVTFSVNLVLLVMKGVAVALSGSISIISSLLDSAMDLVSGVVIWWTSRAIQTRNPYIYPQGRTKLEPVGIVILAIIMAVSSLQIIKESIVRMVMYEDTTRLPHVDYIVIGISVFTIGTKLTLYLYSRRIASASVQALAQDHRNDVLTNFTAILFGYCGSEEMRKQTRFKPLGLIDPIGAILISLYIIVTWGVTALNQIRMLTGYRADPQFLSKITFMCVNHHLEILKVDTVRAFHFGLNFLVEVDIVLPETMSLKEAHNIAEPLQQKIESLDEVERAFVHVDYEVEHNPNHEHKYV